MAALKPLALGLTCLAFACGEGAPGDLDKVPPTGGDILGGGQRLHQLNDRTGGAHPPDGTLVNVTAVSVLAVDTYDETSDGASAGNIYAQDLPVGGATPPYGGITLFDASFSPPTLRIAAGDVVDVRGTYDEFEGPSSSPFKCTDPKDEESCASLPEIVGGNISLRFEYGVPAPVVIPLSELATYETGRKWIGVLVRVENVKAQADGVKSTSGRFAVKLDTPTSDPKGLPTINNALLDLEGTGLPFKTGTAFKSVTGVVQYFYNFAISPRTKDDIQL
ncbi:MAG: hypothetical protein L6Q84_24600 [Polyangiaceae bacterium]|nr:hypothetical protein [Polyangiaceae bacterium]